ncbi:iron-sulfur cluster assembly scaffold protein [Candidatus Gottesmanbacteria bacterium]|nr:iron-sulfur cluster assembly scaffold protein [Candidatus Gottesmanbacteria bacterium]
MDLYSQILLDHGQNPRNTGQLKKATHRAEEVNLSCGDKTKVELRIKNYELREIRHQTTGCLVCKFSASMLSEKLIGKTVKEVLKMETEDCLKLLKIKLTMSRLKCALLPLLAIQKALKNEN